MSLSVRRVLSEKKEAFAVEARGILKDIKTDLGIDGIVSVRVINRYDVSGLSDDEYKQAREVVFSEPPVDYVYDEKVDLSKSCYVLIIEALPGQYDQRADSAAQCAQFLTQKERPLVKTAKVIAFYGVLDDEQKLKIEKYLINPVDCRKASEEKPETLEDNFDVPSEVSTIEGFTTMSESELSSLRVDMGLAMSDADIIFTQKHFIEEKREPTVTEIRVLDTYWSDHCRHTTFLTELTDIKFEGDDALTQEIKATFDDYILSRKDLYADRLSS